MAEEIPFDALMARLQAGDAEAASVVFHRFAHRLIGLARQRLDQRVRRKEDPEDVMQSVFKSFFRRQAGDAFQIGDWDSLWALLATITLRKCGHHVEYFHAARRDVAREVAPPASDGSGVAWQGLAREPTPAEAAVLAETLEEIMRPLDQHQRQIFELTLQGNVPAQVAAAAGCTQRTVHRVLQRVRQRLEKLSVA